MAVNLLPMFTPGARRDDSGGDDGGIRRQLAEALLMQSLKQGGGQPIQHWTQGAAQVMDSLTSALMYRKAMQDESEARKAGGALMLDLLSAQQQRAAPGNSSAQPPLPMAAAPPLAAKPPDALDFLPPKLPALGKAEPGIADDDSNGGAPSFPSFVRPGMIGSQPPPMKLGLADRAMTAGRSPPEQSNSVEFQVPGPDQNALKADLVRRLVQTQPVSRETSAATTSAASTSPLAFLQGDPRFASFAKPTGTRLQNLTDVILHDRGGPYPANAGPNAYPYHVEVLPDGSIKQHWSDTHEAPHAYGMNPISLGIAYADRVGAKPTPEALKSLRDIVAGLKAYSPNLRFRSHGEAYRDTRGGDLQASRHGRALDEASWRTDVLGQPSIAGMMKLGGPKPNDELPVNAPQGIAQRRVQTQTIAPDQAPQGGMPQSAPTAPPQPLPSQQPAGQSQAGISTQEMDILRKMINSRDQATRNAGIQMLQQYQKRLAPMTDKERAELEQTKAHTRYYDAASAAMSKRAEAAATTASARKAQAYDKLLSRFQSYGGMRQFSRQEWETENQPGGIVHAAFGGPVPFERASMVLAQARQATDPIEPDETERTLGITREDKIKAYRQQRINELWGVKDADMLRKGTRLRPDGSMEAIPGAGNTQSERTGAVIARQGLRMLEEGERLLKENPAGQYIGDTYRIPGTNVEFGGYGQAGKGFAAIRAAIMDLNFALSGKSVSNAEREAFLRLYMPSASDSNDRQAFKIRNIRNYFQEVLRMREGGASDEDIGQYYRQKLHDGERGSVPQDAPANPTQNRLRQKYNLE